MPVQITLTREQIADIDYAWHKRKRDRVAMLAQPAGENSKTDKGHSAVLRVGFVTKRQFLAIQKELKTP